MWSAHLSHCFFSSSLPILVPCPAAKSSLVVCTAPCWAASRYTVQVDRSRVHCKAHLCAKHSSLCRGDLPLASAHLHFFGLFLISALLLSRDHKQTVSALPPCEIDLPMGVLLTLTIQVCHRTGALIVSQGSNS